MGNFFYFHSQDMSISPLWFPYVQMQTMPPPLKVVAAQGAKFRLENGQELIDSISSWWCAIHGYNHPEINSALQEQMQKFSHIMLGGLTHEPAEKLAEELVRITPQGLNRVFFADSGSVGMEVAMKMAVQFFSNNGIQGKNKFASLYKGYHGDTTGVMSIGDPEEGMHHLFKGFLPKQFFINANLQEMEELFKEHSAEIAAFVCEPLLQGAGGFNFYPPEFLNGARLLCDKYNVLWIADEVATGFGRTGTMFACEQAHAVPDIMVLGKALTAGYLGLSATLATDKVYNSFLGTAYDKAFMHGPTFMGNALACSAALASLKIFERENYLQKIARINEILKEELLGFEASGVKETRVFGACGVIETQNEEAHKGIQEFAASRGVWLRPFLRVVYTMPPYIISESELRKVCSVMKDYFCFTG
ncbi:MAG: adenosylmethionine--8-amino-7-oxononanoate transaminase [Fibromonadaceae bacterium]|jgi:adenosylmethionine-8-amino-7-oxononanoate aminotransferase|nr:adenosylmethionine--8-amino-7-oxononanoate transaminase [Fibromonadaceae bacterium]